MKLSKAGYGTILEILDTPVDLVLDMISYEEFCMDYESEFIELNKEESK